MMRNQIFSPIFEQIQKTPKLRAFIYLELQLSQFSEKKLSVCSQSNRNLFAVCSQSVRNLFAVCSQSVRSLFAICSQYVRKIGPNNPYQV